MKVLFILDLYKPHIGGAEILFENIIVGLEHRGVKCCILTSRYDTHLKPYEKISENIEIYRVGHNRYDFMFYSLFLGIKLAKEVDIIHTTTYNSAIPARIIATITGKKVVLTVLEIFGNLWYSFLGWKGFFYKSFEWFIFQFRFDRYICISHYTKNSLRISFRIKDERLKTIYCGIDHNFWNRKNIHQENILELRKSLKIEENLVGLFFGRSGISKGLDYYLKAIPDIVKNIPHFKALLIVSDSKNNPIKKVEQEIERLNIQNKVILIPGVKRSQLPEYIVACDFVIIPSLAEGFGFAVAEVSALEQKLITTSIGSIPEVASGDVIFVEPQNSKEICNAVVLLSEKKYTNIPKKNFSWDENIDTTLQIYSQLLGKEES